MLIDLIIRFKKEIILLEEPGRPPTLQLPQGSLTLEQLDPDLLSAFRVLATTGATESYLSEQIVKTASVTDFQTYLARFKALGLICHTLMTDRQPLATLIPISPAFLFQMDEIELDIPYVLSRFAYCHKVGREMILESPLAHAEIVLPDWRGLALIAELTEPKSYNNFGFDAAVLSLEAINLFFVFLLNIKAISAVDANGTIQEEDTPSLYQWEFHDLLFHTRSRLGRHPNPYGAHYPFKTRGKPLPAVKPKMTTKTIDLYKPDLEKLKQTELPFSFILENRRSIRDYGEQPLTIQQIGEFLYRVGRVKEFRTKGDEQLSIRPYPSGGACYGLELYVVINIASQIPAGLYVYDPLDHQLGWVRGKDKMVEGLLLGGQGAMGKQSLPPVMVVITSRFQRVSWKYQSIAYALILKEVGVLFQTMYLVATAMGLAGCALGGGNSDLFSRISGTDYYAETSVGEFVLGSMSNEGETSS